MNRVCARWVPRILTAEHLAKRVELSKQFIKKVNRGDIRLLYRIITTDESWFHYYDPETKQQSSQWKNCNSPPPKKAKITKSLRKNMLILFMDRKGMLLTHAVPRGQTVNSEYMYYSKVINIIITFEINELIIFPVNLIIGYYTVLCIIWKDIVRVCIVLKTSNGRDAAGVESNTGF